MSSSKSALEIAQALRQPPPTEEQVQVIEASPDQPLLVVAGAGSGKTETMSARVVWLVANGHVPPEQILGLTFTRKAAGELSARVRKRLAQLRAAGLVHDDRPVHERALATPTISTYNAYAARLVSEHALRLGIEPDAITLSEAGRWQLVHDIVFQWPDDLQVSGAPSTIVSAVISLSGACAEHLLEPEDVGDYFEGLVQRAQVLAGDKKPVAAVREVLERWQERGRLVPLLQEYQRRKRENNLLDFSDQVSLIARLVRQSPEISKIERERFQAVLLDEYQDTSYAQVELLSGLFRSGHPVTAVGDPLQAIYGWRGASAGALERFPSTFPEKNHKTGEIANSAALTLSVAWRNDKNVLKAANRTAAPLKLGLSSDSIPLKNLQPRPGAGEGSMRAHFAETSGEEAAYIAEFLSRERQKAALAGREMPSAAVLCRKRSQFDDVVAALSQADVPVEVVGIGGLLDTPEVTDVVAMLRVVHDPSRGDALMRLLTNPRWNLGVADLHGLAGWAKIYAGEDRDDRSIIDALDELSAMKEWPGSGPEISEPGRVRLRDFGAQLRSLRKLTGMRLPELVSEVERALFFDIEFAIDPQRFAQSRRHVEDFRHIVEQYEASGGMGVPVTLSGFLDWLDAARVEERGLPVTSIEPNSDAVQVLTVHASKGLEWDVVVVAGLNEGTFPSCRPRKDPNAPILDSGWLKDWGQLPYELRGDSDGLPVFGGDGAADITEFKDALDEFRIDNGAYQLAEERRLAYVAITRARALVLLTGSWWAGEGKTPLRPSRFLTALVRSGMVEADVTSGPREEENPQQGVVETATWPEETDDYRQRLQDAAQRVHDARGRVIDLSGEISELNRAEEKEELTASVAAQIAIWYRHGELLLAESQTRDEPQTDVELPGHLSASSLMALLNDPKRFALARRRPIPVQPTADSRRGTAFHNWVEHLYKEPVLVDVEDALSGELDTADDADFADESDGEIKQLQEAFLASPWAHRQPTHLEADVETHVAGVPVRCRIDAIFTDQEGRVTIVDWKTGRPPGIKTKAHQQRSVQLALYRHAWASLHDLDPEQIGAVFIHVNADGVREVPAVDVSEEEIAQHLRDLAPQRRVSFQ